MAVVEPQFGSAFNRSHIVQDCRVREGECGRRLSNGIRIFQRPEPIPKVSVWQTSSMRPNTGQPGSWRHNRKEGPSIFPNCWITLAFPNSTLDGSVILEKARVQADLACARELRRA